MFPAHRDSLQEGYFDAHKVVTSEAWLINSGRQIAFI